MFHTTKSFIIAYKVQWIKFIDLSIKRFYNLKKNFFLCQIQEEKLIFRLNYLRRDIIIKNPIQSEVFMALPFNIFYLLVQYLYFLILNIKIVKFDSNNHNHIQWLPFFHSFVSQCVLIYLEFMIKLRLQHEIPSLLFVQEYHWPLRSPIKCNNFSLYI